MEMEKRAEAAPPSPNSWVPETPIKPIPPRPEPICKDMQEHPQGLQECSDSEEFPPGFAPRAQADEFSGHGSSGRAEIDAGLNFEALLSSGDSTLWPGMAATATAAAMNMNVPFLSLMALADAAVTGSSQKDFTRATNGSFTCFSDSYLKGNWLPSEPAKLSSSCSGSNLSQFSSISANHSAQNSYGLQNLPAHAYDVNLSPGTRADAASNGAIPHFAPITPDKALGAQSRTVFETYHFGEKDQTSQNQCFSDGDAAGRLVRAEHVKELLKVAADAPSADVSTSPNEDNKIEKVDDQGISKTPQQKPRRKKHRPKVVSEGKARRTPKPRTPRTAGTEGETRVKRKYVRRKGIEKPPPSLPTEVAEDAGGQNRDEPLKMSCRRALNFDSEQQQMNDAIAGQSVCVGAAEQANADDQLPQRIEVKVGDATKGIAHELSHGVNQKPTEDTPFLESQDPGITRPAQTRFQQEKLDSHCPAMSLPGDQVNAPSAPDLIQMKTLTSPNKPFATDGEQPTDSKRKCCDPSEQIRNGYMNMLGIQFNSLQAYESVPRLCFPPIHKKKRTEKGQISASGTSSSMKSKMVKRLGITSCLDAERANLIASKVDQSEAILQERGTELQDEQQTVGCMLAFSQTERSTKKRSRGLTRVRDLASLSKLTEYCMMPTYPLQQSATDDRSQNTHTCMQALLMEMNAKLSRRKRTKRHPLVNSAYSRALTLQLNGRVQMHRNHQRAAAHTLGHQPELLWKHISPVDAIIKLLENLDINRESSENAHQEQNALIPYGFGKQDHQNMLVLYRGDGTIVPFDGPFDPAKKRRPRPKVDLDEETTRVWKLLLEDISSQGIDGTDEEKARWWQEERRVFKGRTDSFIARMHLVQGDRRFSPWKGSVVDSVVGVFLTQNVSDHLSSSAFMSLAARFPKNPRQNQCFEEGTSSVINEPDVCTQDLEYTSKWREKMSSPTICDRSSMTLNEAENSDEVEVVNSEESFTRTAGKMRSLDESNCHFLNSNSSRSFMEMQPHSTVNKFTIDNTESICTDVDRKAEIDVISSQESAVSSHNSMDFLKAVSDERKGSSSDNSETDDLTNRSKLSKTSSADAHTPFMQLLHLAGSNLHEVYVHEIGDISSNENSKDALIKSLSKDDGGERQDIDATNATNSMVLEDECSQESREGGKSSESYKVDSGSCMDDGVTAINQYTTKYKIRTAVNKIPSSMRCNQICTGSTVSKNCIDQHPEHLLEVQCLREDDRMEEPTCMPKLSCENWQNSCSKNLPEGSNQESVERCISEQVHPAPKESNEMNVRASKAKTGAAGKDRKVEIDWDSLRRQAVSSGSKRERSQNTMDSVDWEAVRCADVNEIAQTIKDRGMNNVLAGRIQDFLNRLVGEHGSIDLEWLRDVPPDKAKEYLLSFRGLGLKSVECVRLLTLHHLAFPVDTNVGRIAVRLGWVPLQPLPESLQLHLLELYPVLESIQKYLWPRLCKLDQRTLYELHYQMITFGKVFCTKSKPNCNACPMRGECRHFASAFASARLALPGPEQKSIVGSSETVTPTNNTEPLQLPSPLATDNSQKQLARYGQSNCQPIIEEPASPGPECTHVVENDREEIDLEDFDEIPTIKLNIEEFTQNLQNYMQQNMELQEGDMSKALVALTPEAASIPAPKLKNLDKLEPDDPCKYLLAIWTPGETANSIEPPEQKCNSQEIPCRTAMRGSFPLNGTYFQVFADHESSLHPIDVPRDWLWKLQRRTVYFGTSIPAIFKGLSTEGIQHCFWRGYVCVRGFDRQTRAPRPLMARLHFPASKLPRTRGKPDDGL
ncbi:hypothetical protein CDL15_Pgr002071 [Punica granatum]|uniref:HhH-GPD domain-containing protein n=1 Tax=Punica granatum TaxID=22663 RepID=A0A218XCR4_PUNGR|nr:hypothetical protein CDL15_Pgr002071 [Punica granatum]